MQFVSAVISGDNGKGEGSYLNDNDRALSEEGAKRQTLTKFYSLE